MTTTAISPSRSLAALRDRLKRSFSDTPRTLQLVWETSARATLALAGLTLLASGAPVLVAYVGKLIIDAVAAKDAELAFRWVLLELVIVAFQALVQRGLGLVRSLLGARLSMAINERILEKTQTLSLHHFEDAEFYDQLTRARREASSRPISVVTETFQLLQNALTLSAYVAVLTRFSLLAVPVLLVAGIPATVVEMRFSGTAFRLRNWRSQDARKQNYLEYVLANDAHAKEVKLLGLGPLLLERYKRQGETFYREDRQLAVRRAVWAYLLSLLATLAFYGTYASMVLGAAAGRLSLGDMTLYIAAFRQGQQAFQSILTAIGGMYEDNLYMSNLFQFLAIKTEATLEAASDGVAPSPEAGDGVRTKDAASETASASPLPARQTAARETGGTLEPSGADNLSGFSLQQLGFRYPGQERWALRNITLQIPAGKSAAFVGQNGAGKTTLIKLLTRLYQPTEGRILLDGRPLNDWPEEVLRQRLAVVFQDFNQYQFTARENVGLGSVPHLEDTPRIGRALERGGADAIIPSLKDGLETQLGRWFQKGVSLSGGQWQKVALARAFMREEADLLILDEPTAALDAESEHAVFERFRTLAKGRTSILISHRFPTVRMADQIFVIEQGELQESGTHEALLAKGGRYAQLFTLQAQGYF